MKYILVTGANGGLASSIINDLLNKNEFVIGLDISEPKTMNNYLGIKVDITDDKSVEFALSEVTKITDHLDAIINTAGIMSFGSLIEEKPEVMKRMLEVNLVGMYRINYYFMPLVEKCLGRVINFSSEYGKYQTIPFHGFYTTSKHAVEAYSDGLRRELMFLGIKVITIRPGAFKTNMQRSIFDVFNRVIGNTNHYKKQLTKMQGMLAIGEKSAKEADVLSKVVLKAVYTKHPKIAYKINHNFGINILSKCPNGFVDRLFYKFFK